MSEYQYYEFRTIDRPLDKNAMAKLRTITSRAEITSTSLVNEYHWGDFKGNVDDLMAKYFDAFLYFANWGTHRLSIRLPVTLIDEGVVAPYCVDGRVYATQTKEHLILDFWSPEDCYDEEWEDWRLDKFLALRTDLMAGDLSCLYLAWLSAVQYGDVDDDVLEPPVPPGLREVSGPLRDLEAFMYLGENLVEIAAEESAAKSARPSDADLKVWIKTLSDNEKDLALLRTLRGESVRTVSELMGRFRETLKSNAESNEDRPRRTAGFLRNAAEERARMEEQKRAEQAARAKQKRERDAAAARAKHLASLSGRETELWNKVDRLVATKQPNKYDEAVLIIKDLHELSCQGTDNEFWPSLGRLRGRHSAKSSFLDRLREAKFIGSGIESAVKKREA